MMATMDFRNSGTTLVPNVRVSQRSDSLRIRRGARCMVPALILGYEHLIAPGLFLRLMAIYCWTMGTHHGLFTAIGVGRSIGQSPPSLLLHAMARIRPPSISYFCSSTPLCLHTFSLGLFGPGDCRNGLPAGLRPHPILTRDFFEPDTGTPTPYFYVVVRRGVSKPACGVFDPSGSQARRCLTKPGLIHSPSAYTVSEAPLCPPTPPPRLIRA
ncbi:hypothetical protein B0H13DRAFT_2275274 [Mycena leptocephala]|nr:hypothetical protein B0H13DRAFT_2275274 [Mycena leptocephala]